MRHNKSGKSLGRNSSHRKAMLRNMVTSLFEHEKITTTDARAKELRKVAEKLITLGKRGDLHARRQAATVLRDQKTLTKLFDRVAPRYLERPGGYTRIIKLGLREGDKAALSRIELVEEEFKPKTKKKAPVAAKPAKKEAPAAPKENKAKSASEEVSETVEVKETATEETAAEESSSSPEETVEAPATVESDQAGVDSSKEPAAEEEANKE